MGRRTNRNTASRVSSRATRGPWVSVYPATGKRGPRSFALLGMTRLFSPFFLRLGLLLKQFSAHAARCYSNTTVIPWFLFPRSESLFNEGAAWSSCHVRSSDFDQLSP